MQITIKDIQTQEIVAQGSVDQIKALYEEEDVLDAIDQAIEDQAPVVVYGFVGNGIEITATESSNQMQNQNLQIVKSLNDYNSKHFYAIKNKDGIAVVYSEEDQALNVDGRAVFHIEAISETRCIVSLLDDNGLEINSHECQIEGLANAIDSEMILRAIAIYQTRKQ